MTWSGNMKRRESGRPNFRRQRYSSNSSRGSPSPKLLEERYSPVQTNEKPLLALRISSPSYQADGSLSRSPSPQGNAYAGPKFSEPPSPEVLPRPPTHWTSYGISFSGTGSCSDMSSQLKLLLKVASQQA